LTIILFVELLSSIIPIENIDRVVDEIVVFLGMIAIILFLILGLKKIFDIYKEKQLPTQK